MGSRNSSADFRNQSPSSSSARAGGNSGKKQSLLLICALIIVLMAGASAFFLMHSGQPDNKPAEEPVEQDEAVVMTFAEMESIIDDANLNSRFNEAVFLTLYGRSAIQYGHDYFADVEGRLALANVGVREEYARDSGDYDCQSSDYATFDELRGIYARLFNIMLASEIDGEVEKYNYGSWGAFVKNPCTCSCPVEDGDYGDYAYLKWGGALSIDRYVTFLPAGADADIIYGTVTESIIVDYDEGTTEDKEIATFELGYEISEDGDYYFTSLVLAEETSVE